MRRYHYAIDNVRAHLRSLWAVIGLQTLVILVLRFGWSQAPRELGLILASLRSETRLSFPR